MLDFNFDDLLIGHCNKLKPIDVYQRIHKISIWLHEIQLNLNDIHQQINLTIDFASSISHGSRQMLFSSLSLWSVQLKSDDLVSRHFFLFYWRSHDKHIVFFSLFQSIYWLKIEADESFSSYVIVFFFIPLCLPLILSLSLPFIKS